MDEFSSLLNALRDMVFYSQHHEGWQDDHVEIVIRAKGKLAEHGVPLKEYGDDPDAVWVPRDGRCLAEDAP